MGRDTKTKRFAEQVDQNQGSLTTSDITDLSTYLANLTDTEVQQLQNIGSSVLGANVWAQIANIGAETISAAQWAVLATIHALSNSKLLGTDGTGQIESKDAASFIDGTANEITVTDDGDGTVTIEGAGDDTDFDVVSSIQAGGAGGVGFQYKTRTLTMNGGIITTVGAESGWNDV